MQEMKLEDTKTRILPYAYEQLKNGNYVVSSYFGSWGFFSEGELSRLKSKDFSAGDELYKKLEESNIIVTKSNLSKIVDRYRELNSNLFMKPSLHMINMTNTCNYRCKYCHAGVSQGKDFMDEKTALKVVEFIFRSDENPPAGGENNNSPQGERNGGTMNRDLLPWSPLREIMSMRETMDRFFDEPNSRLQSSFHPSVGIRETEKSLIIEAEALREKCVKCEEFNVQLQEKEKMLEYEFTKARAQVIGLEKICEDFKKKIEENEKSVGVS